MIEVIRLNLGCGIKRFHKPDYINIDISPECEPDILMDITKPWDIQENSIEKIRADNVLEHVGRDVNGEDLLQVVMNEAHRVLVPDGEFWIRVPDVIKWPFGAFRDPGHSRFFCAGSFDYMDIDHNTYRNYGKSYGYKPWKVQVSEQRNPANNAVFIIAILKASK